MAQTILIYILAPYCIEIIEMEDDLKAFCVALKEWAKNNLAGENFISSIGFISISMNGIKETINQPHRFQREKIAAIYEIERLLAQAEFVKNTPDKKYRPFTWHYLKITIAGQHSYIVIREDKQSGIKILYSIVDNIK